MERDGLGVSKQHHTQSGIEILGSSFIDNRLLSVFYHVVVVVVSLYSVLLCCVALRAKGIHNLKMSKYCVGLQV
jgi:hypothetical protein